MRKAPDLPEKQKKDCVFSPDGVLCLDIRMDNPNVECGVRSVELWCFLRKDEMYVPIQPHPMFRINDRLLQHHL